MTIAEIQFYLDEIEKDAQLIEDKALDKLLDVIDFLDFHVLGYLDEMLRTSQENHIFQLKDRAEKILHQLEEINRCCFKTIRKNIQDGISASDFKSLVEEYFPLNTVIESEEIGYDNLDIFFNGILNEQEIPAETKVLEPEMIYYQKTPARIVLELVAKAGFKQHDVFYDIGCGLGQVVILVNLLTGVKTKGIEYEPAFYHYACNTAKTLHLNEIEFMNADARNADYSQGTVFFMFTPFVGNMLQEVLDLLRKEPSSRKIKIFTYGPCSQQIAKQAWLYTDATEITDHKLYLFQRL